MEIDKTKALARNKYCYDAQMTLSRQSQIDLQWLLDNLRDISAPIYNANLISLFLRMLAMQGGDVLTHNMTWKLEDNGV